MISRTSWAHRQARAKRAAQSTASARDDTSMIANPPITALVSGSGAVRGRAVGADDGGRPALDAAAEDPGAGVLHLLDHRACVLADTAARPRPDVVHRAVIERDQVPRHR
jgi:hypothetical protein